MVEGQVQVVIEQIAREKLGCRPGRKHPRFDEPGRALDDKGLPEVEPGLFQTRLAAHRNIKRLQIVQVDPGRSWVGLRGLFPGIHQRSQREPLGLQTLACGGQIAQGGPHPQVTALHRRDGRAQSEDVP